MIKGRTPMPLRVWIKDKTTGAWIPGQRIDNPSCIKEFQLERPNDEFKAAKRMPAQSSNYSSNK